MCIGERGRERGSVCIGERGGGGRRERGSECV